MMHSDNIRLNHSSEALQHEDPYIICDLGGEQH